MPNRAKSLNSKGSPILYWSLSLLCSFIIFLVVPFTRTLEQFISNTIGGIFFTWIALIGIIFGFVVLGWLAHKTRQQWEKKQYYWIFIVFLLYLSITIYLSLRSPEEAIHLIEYSLLTFLLFKALTLQNQDKMVIGSTINLVFLVGTLDEFLQWITPERFWDFRDVAINFASGCLCLAALAPFYFKDLNQKATHQSIKLLVWTTSINLVLIGLVFSNTPSMIQGYTAIFEQLEWLQREEQMVSDFGVIGLYILWSSIIITTILVFWAGHIWSKKYPNFWKKLN